MDRVIKDQLNSQFTLLSSLSLAQHFLQNGTEAAIQLIWTWCTFGASDSSETNNLRIHFLTLRGEQLS